MSREPRVRPLLLLDVDGVVNALPDESDDLMVWSDWKSGWARADGSRYHITFAPEVVAQLLAWHTSGALELQWLTTWGHDANDELRVLLGLPELTVAGTHQDAGAPSEVDAASHADVAPAAPDPLTGRWWKYDVVRRVLAEQPGRTVIWVDDELYGPSRFRTWGEEHPDVVPVGPNPRCGLVQADFDQIVPLVSRSPGAVPTD
jgi:hypothetical protein